MIYHFKENSNDILSIIIALYKLIIYKSFYEFGSIVKVQRAYCAKFNKKIAPNTSTIRNIVSVFEKTGSVSPTPQNAKVQARSEKTPKMS